MKLEAVFFMCFIEYLFQKIFLRVTGKQRSLDSFCSKIDYRTTTLLITNLSSQPKFTCSKSTWKHKNNVKTLSNVNNKDTRTTSLKLFWCPSCQVWTDFTHWYGVSIFDFDKQMPPENFVKLSLTCVFSKTCVYGFFRIIARAKISSIIHKLWKLVK